MKDKRPVNLDLTKFHFPITAIISILHRISGVFLFLFIPVLLWLLQQSLQTADTFYAVQQLIATPWIKLVLWAFLASILYHLVAGIRHLLMDLGWGVNICCGSKSSWFVIFTSIVLIVIAGFYIWL